MRRNCENPKPVFSRQRQKKVFSEKNRKLLIRINLFEEHKLFSFRKMKQNCRKSIDAKRTIRKQKTHQCPK